MIALASDMGTAPVERVGDWQALERALGTASVREPVLAARATRALDRLLEGVYASPWQEIAWSFSHLTRDGFPVEFTFSSEGGVIRYTAEVAGPEVNDAERLIRAQQQILRLGARQTPESMSRLLHAVQRGGPLRYGAWVSGRHSPDGDSYKLYAEVPAAGSLEAERLTHSLLGDAPLLTQRATRLCMIGYDPYSSRTELYFRVDGLEFWELVMLLRRVGLHSRVADLRDLIEEAYDHSIEPAMPSSRLGFSYSISKQGEPSVFSIFAVARTVFGSDTSVRRRILALAARRGWRLEIYEALSEPLACRNDQWSHHGVVGFIIKGEFPPALHICLRPPEGPL